jgi:LysR family transcriptional regulator, cys regulon transcriptional activator
MNFQQLRIVRETVRKNFNLTEVGVALCTSQSGVSKHIKDLEDELGVLFFHRKGKRLLGLTDSGHELLELVERILLDAKNIKQLAKQFSQSDHGQLIVATTHTQARYAIPPVVAAFKEVFPKVHLVLHQASPPEIIQMLLDGRADIGIATEAVENHGDLVTFEYYSWQHTVVVPQGHDLQKLVATGHQLQLSDLAEYPIVTYHDGFTGRKSIDTAFLSAGIAPDIVMSALDADVLKTYIELGLGVGIIAEMAFQEERDILLCSLESSHLFPINTTHIALRKGQILRGYAYNFIQLCSKKLNETYVRGALKPANESELD